MLSLFLARSAETWPSSDPTTLWPTPSPEWPNLPYLVQTWPTDTAPWRSAKPPSQSNSPNITTTAGVTTSYTSILIGCLSGAGFSSLVIVSLILLYRCKHKVAKLDPSLISPIIQDEGDYTTPAF